MKSRAQSDEFEIGPLQLVPAVADGSRRAIPARWLRFRQIVNDAFAHDVVADGAGLVRTSANGGADATNMQGRRATAQARFTRRKLS